MSGWEANCGGGGQGWALIDLTSLSLLESKLINCLPRTNTSKPNVLIQFPFQIIFTQGFSWCIVIYIFPFSHRVFLKRNCCKALSSSLNIQWILFTLFLSVCPDQFWFYVSYRQFQNNNKILIRGVKRPIKTFTFFFFVWPWTSAWSCFANTGLLDVN